MEPLEETVKATIVSETDQNGIREEEILVEEQGTGYIPPAFKLIVGMRYRLASKLVMQVLAEEKGLFLGLVQMEQGNRAVPTWYLPDGTVERDLDKFPDQDAFDVVSIHHEPHTVYLLRDNMTLEYGSNTCFLSRDAAVEAALKRKLQVVAFKEVQDQ